MADSYFTAQKAADILEAEWVAVEDFSTKSVHESLVKAKQEKASEGFELGQRPNTISNDTLTIDYEAGWQAHATMEPQTCTVKYSPTFIEIWTPTQVPIWAKKTIESFTGLSPSQVRFHVTF